MRRAQEKKKKISLHPANILSIHCAYFNSVIFFFLMVHMTAFECTCESCSLALNRAKGLCYKYVRQFKGTFD